jgi:molybdopterin synthase sulfur carrier subunit
MQVTLKLFASLTDFLPPEHRAANQVGLTVPEGHSVAAVITQFALPDKLVHLVLVNGTYIAPEARATRVLVEGDALAIWPPIAGG